MLLCIIDYNLRFPSPLIPMVFGPTFPTSSLQ